MLTVVLPARVATLVTPSTPVLVKLPTIRLAPGFICRLPSIVPFPASNCGLGMLSVCVLRLETSIVPPPRLIDELEAMDASPPPLFVSTSVPAVTYVGPVYVSTCDRNNGEPPDLASVPDPQ